MPYISNDQMVDDLLASMNIDESHAKDSVYINGALARQALGYKLAAEDEKKKDDGSGAATKDASSAVQGMTSNGENAGAMSESSGGGDFDASAISDIIGSLMA